MIFKTRSALVRYKKMPASRYPIPTPYTDMNNRKLVENSLLWKPANFDSGCSFHSDFVHDCREVLRPQKQMENKHICPCLVLPYKKKPLVQTFLLLLLLVFAYLRAKVLTCSPWLSTGHHSIAHTLGNISSTGVFQGYCLLFIAPNILSLTPSK